MCLTCRSLAQNYLTNDGKDMSGVLKLAEVLPSTSITSLKYALAYLPNIAVDSSHYRILTVSGASLAAAWPRTSFLAQMAKT